MTKVHRAILLLTAGILSTGFFIQASANNETDDVPYDLAEKDIQWLQDEMEAGRLSSLAIVDAYLGEIERIDRHGPGLNSVIETNPDARSIAAELDEERAAGKVRGPLHGIPILLKANIDTGDAMATSAGSLALASHRAPDDAFLVSQLRDAGMVILGKTNLSEWANYRSNRSSSGWSSLGGQTRNPYDPDRNPCGSSSGSGVAVSASLTSVAIGTETWGSIICPSGINGVVGIKPTVGLVSRDGIIPISHTQDTAGPMARTVRDAALILSAMSALDAKDSAMTGRPAIVPDFAASLSADGLKGKRIGILRNYYRAGDEPHADAVFAQALETLREAGAELVDPIEIDFGEIYPSVSLVLNYEFKDGLNRYLTDSGAPVASLEALIAYNEEHAATVMPFFGQETFLEAQNRGPLSTGEYQEAVAITVEKSRAILDAVLAEYDLDALVAPSNSPAWLTDHVHGDTSFGASSSAFAAISGYAAITVPAGLAERLPVGLSFFAGAYSEASLIQLAYAFEQAHQGRQRPDLP